jgi:peptide/nickel transport system ATP-binding protein
VGCRFAPRCRFAIDECRRAQPELREIEGGHKVACIRAEETTSA